MKSNDALIWLIAKLESSCTKTNYSTSFALQTINSIEDRSLIERMYANLVLEQIYEASKDDVEKTLLLDAMSLLSEMIADGKWRGGEVMALERRAVARSLESEAVHNAFSFDEKNLWWLTERALQYKGPDYFRKELDKILLKACTISLDGTSCLTALKQ